jgi:hypothetical protein
MAGLCHFPEWSITEQHFPNFAVIYKTCCYQNHDNLKYDDHFHAKSINRINE